MEKQSKPNTPEQTPVIELRHVDKHYGQLHVLKDINLSVKKGEVVVIIGPSGSGKSTLCRTINRMETINSGEILIDGTAIPQEGKELARLRAQVGMVFQSFNLFAHKTILDNVTLGPTDVLHVPKKEAREEAIKLLKRVGVDTQAAKLPAQLSGGQQQRVAIARALMNNPPVVFADEPTGNLDTKSSIEIMNLFTELSNEGITIVMVTHEDDIAAYAKRHVVMRDGKVMRDDLNDGTGRKSQDEVARLVKEALA